MDTDTDTDTDMNMEVDMARCKDQEKFFLLEVTMV